MKRQLKMGMAQVSMERRKFLHIFEPNRVEI